MTGQVARSRQNLTKLIDVSKVLNGEKHCLRNSVKSLWVGLCLPNCFTLVLPPSTSRLSMLRLEYFATAPEQTATIEGTPLNLNIRHASSFTLSGSTHSAVFGPEASTPDTETSTVSLRTLWCSFFPHYVHHRMIAYYLLDQLTLFRAITSQRPTVTYQADSQ